MRSQLSFSQHVVKWSIYFIGLLVMALGAVLTIKAELGTTPWDVFHIGLFLQLGLTIGTWSIIVGFVILVLSAILLKKLPQVGAFLNMIFVGIFIDMYMVMPFLHTPHTLLGKVIMLVLGTVIMGYGIGIYISARCGAGPRDSLMIALTEKTGWKVQYIRFTMEGIVLIFGWLLGGPVFIGTVLITFTIGSIIGITLPQCQQIADKLIKKVEKKGSIHFNHFSN